MTGEGSLQTTVESDGAATVLRLRGEIDMATTPELDDCLRELVGTVIVDLSDVSFLDSSGMGTIVGARNRLEGASGELWLRAPQPHVRRVLEITGLGALILSDR